MISGCIFVLVGRLFGTFFGMEAGMDTGVSSTAGAGGGAVGAIILLVQLAIGIFMIAALWKVFTKAGKPGWGILVPIYNAILLLQIAGRPAWWIILCFIPAVNIIIFILVYIDIAKNFGKGAGFGIGLLLLPIIFFPILGFGSAQYMSSSTELPQGASE